MSFRIKLGTAKSKNYVNNSSHFAYKVCLRIILLKSQFKFSLGGRGKRTYCYKWLEIASKYDIPLNQEDYDTIMFILDLSNN